MNNIPQCDPRASYMQHRAEIDGTISRVLETGRYVLGPEVEAFEREFSAWTGAEECVGVANGTDALEIALRAVGVGTGDTVVTVSHTAVATVVAIRATGAQPLFVDVDRDSGQMDCRQLESVLELAAHGKLATARQHIKAVVPVHLYGACADMSAICVAASSFGLAVVEDCAQAHGASVGGRNAGSWGDAGSFSFYPTKNLGALGDGGAVVFNKPGLADSARLLRQYGWASRYVSSIEGMNSRLDELQAAILRVKLKFLESENQRRREIAALYLSHISHPEVLVPEAFDRRGHVYHQFVVRASHRDSLQHHLSRNRVGSLIHYPVPIHMQPAYSNPAYAPLPLTETERWSDSVLSLPMYPQLSDEDAGAVISAVNSWTP